MSETIKTVVTGYMVCAFTGGVLEYLVPTKSKSALRIVVTVAVIFATLLPVSKSDISFEGFYNVEEASENTQLDALMHTANLTEKKIYNEVREVLINLGINEYEIYVITSVDEEACVVYLDEVKVEVSGEFEGEIDSIKANVSEEYKDILKVAVT